jgi:hypothetical protein
LDFRRDYNFTALSPSLRQTFFVGDGRTTEGSVPTVPGANRGYALVSRVHRCVEFRHEPGFHDDNIGSRKVTVRLG